MSTQKILVCGLSVDSLDLDAAIERVLELSQHEAFNYVVTPNAAHFVKYCEEYENLGSLYENAALVLNDSRVVGGFVRLLRGERLAVAPGSDLTCALLDRLQARGARVTVIGVDPARMPTVRARYPNIAFRHHNPPYGFIRDPQAVQACLEFLAEDPTPFTLFCVGNPQQERLAAAWAERPEARGVGLCIGASVDFIAGSQIRAPKALRKAGLEWAFRLAQEPRRMGRRYLVESPRFFYYCLKYRDAPRSAASQR